MGAFDGAGIATNKSNVLSVVSVADPISASGPYRALILAPVRSVLSNATKPPGSWKRLVRMLSMSSRETV